LGRVKGEGFFGILLVLADPAVGGAGSGVGRQGGAGFVAEGVVQENVLIKAFKCILMCYT
jgi:hypothetical protein